MALFMGFLQILNRQLGVMLQSFQVLMPQELFDMVKVGSTPNQFSGAGSPESVRRDIDRQAVVLGVTMHDAQERMIGQPIVLAIDKQNKFMVLDSSWDSIKRKIANKPKANPNLIFATSSEYHISSTCNIFNKFEKWFYY